ncbi:hypothetical protein KC19_5G198400 [Ceratodon purpureus]|uniref:Uncharacterized protein n=1 Tax=Ceratodon purpureus TaxID=3225 RepID=A0A8T0I5Q6_CERPU|nr:hypothetical protein KC19_5G198400 [Ceratodon purpureus]
MEAASMPWFIHFMRLNSRGLTPTVTMTEDMPSRVAVAQFLGPKHRSGYIFDDQGMPEYESYVRELFRRVLQLPWPVSNTMPFHFARGMLAEAMGVEMNWAEFAYRSTHPHQSNARFPRVLLEFEEITEPLEPLIVVMPRVNIEGYSPLSKADSQNARRLLSNPQAHLIPTTSSPNASTARPKGLDMTGGRGKEKHIEMLPAERPSERGECSRKGNCTIDESAAMGLILLRPSFNGTVEAERQRFIAARHDIGKPLHNLRSEIAEDKDRLKFLERKVAEKISSYERASEEYGQARDLYAAARFDQGQPASRDQKTAMKRMTKIRENLIANCFANLEGANTRLASWEFKMKRQNERIAKQTTELQAAEKVYAEKLTILDNSLVHLEAVAIVLADL